MHHLALCANEVQTFCPVTTHSPFDLTALVLSEARSEPDSGSEKPWHQISSADRIGSRNRFFCSSVPCAITTGPPIARPSTFAGDGVSARVASMTKIACSIRVAPRPPYSFGHEIPAQPASCSLLCHSRRNCTTSSSPSGSGPGWFSSSQLRTPSRKPSSCGVSERSMGRELPGSDALDDRARAEAAAAAHRHQAGLLVGALQLVQERGDQAGAGRTEGVSERDRAAVDV